MRIEGVSALVTGASSGIGEALARALVRDGARVALVARSAERLRALAVELGQDQALALPCDVRDPAAAGRAFEATRARFGSVDLLVNNAGIGRYLSLLDTTDADVAAVMETNFLAAVHLSRLVLPEMLTHRHGHLVNVASIAGRIGSRNHALYCASKFALAGFSESLAYELEGTGVGITLVNPGIIDTPFFAHESFASFPARARARAIPAETVADAIIRAVRRGAREITVPRLYAVGTILKTIAPGFFRRLMLRNA